MHSPTAPIRHYHIEPRASHLGGGWRLRCFEGDIEVAGGVFLPDPDMDRDEALNEAHCDAVFEGESWLAGLVESGPDDIPPPATDAQAPQCSACAGPFEYQLMEEAKPRYICNYAEPSRPKGCVLEGASNAPSAPAADTRTWIGSGPA